MKDIFVEKYVKRRGGRFYCDVHFPSVTVRAICTGDKEVAIEKAKAILKATLETYE